MSESQENEVLEQYGHDLKVSFWRISNYDIIYRSNDTEFCGRFQYREDYDKEMTLQDFVNSVSELVYVRGIS